MIRKWDPNVTGKECLYLHDDDGFLNDVADARANEIKQNVHAALCPCLDLDRRLTDGLDTSTYKVDVDFRSVPGSYTLAWLDHSKYRLTHSFNSLKRGSTLFS